MIVTVLLQGYFLVILPVAPVLSACGALTGKGTGPFRCLCCIDTAVSLLLLHVPASSTAALSSGGVYRICSVCKSLLLRVHDDMHVVLLHFP